MIFPRGRSAARRYGRHKVVAILVTFAIFAIYLKVFVPRGVVLSKLDWQETRTSPREAFDARRSGVVVAGRGVIEAVLADSVAAGPAARWKRARVRGDDDFPVVLLWDADDPDPPALDAGDPVRFLGVYRWTTGGGIVRASRSDSSAFGVERRSGGGTDDGGRG